MDKQETVAILLKLARLFDKKFLNLKMPEILADKRFRAFGKIEKNAE